MSAPNRKGDVLRLLTPAPAAPELAEALAIVRRMHARRQLSERGEEYWGHLVFQMSHLEEFGSYDDDPDPRRRTP
jgi:hypothetical protein